MPQFRKDPLGPTWVIISPERGLLASDFGSAAHEGTHGETHQEQDCPLCPGASRSFGEEVRALRPSTSALGAPDWRARVLRPLTGLADADFSDARVFEPQGSPLFTHAPSSGVQELIVEHPEHTMRLSTMSREHLLALLKLYRERLEHLASYPGIRHVQLVRNVGRAAGAGFTHPHALLLALPVTNRWLSEERAAAGEHFARHHRCLFCDVLEAELENRARLISHNEAFLAFAPYASKTPFEVWILPREHKSAFAGVTANTLPLLGDILRSILGAINSALNHPPYNMILHTLPASGDAEYHWHMKLLPRLTAQTGFDWGSGFYVNPTPPEDAARFLREALALQGVAL